MAKSKAQKRLDLIVRLQDIAAGASGGPVCLEGTDWPTLPQYLSPEAFVTFASAVSETFFPDQLNCDLLLWRIDRLVDWSTFDSLADAIITEQERLKATAEAKS